MPPPLKRNATPAQYEAVFSDQVDGAAIMRDLSARFYRVPYVKGGHEADRETAFRAGQFAVIQFILSQVARAQRPDDEDLSNDED